VSSKGGLRPVRGSEDRPSKTGAPNHHRSRAHHARAWAAKPGVSVQLRSSGCRSGVSTNGHHSSRRPASVSFSTPSFTPQPLNNLRARTPPRRLQLSLDARRYSDGRGGRQLAGRDQLGAARRHNRRRGGRVFHRPFHASQQGYVHGLDNHSNFDARLGARADDGPHLARGRAASAEASVGWFRRGRVADRGGRAPLSSHRSGDKTVESGCVNLRPRQTRRRLFGAEHARQSAASSPTRPLSDYGLPESDTEARRFAPERRHGHHRLLHRRIQVYGAGLAGRRRLERPRPFPRHQQLHGGRGREPDVRRRAAVNPRPRPFQHRSQTKLSLQAARVASGRAELRRHALERQEHLRVEERAARGLRGKRFGELLGRC